MFMTQFMQLFATVPKGCGNNFFGLIPWYQYLTINPDCSISNFQVLGSHSDVPLVLLAVIDDLIRVAGLVAVIFVIYGGVQYATSQGNPDQASKAQSTIINALVGLVISVIAVATVSYIGARLTT